MLPLEDGPRCQRKLIHISTSTTPKANIALAIGAGIRTVSFALAVSCHSVTAEQHLNQAMLDGDAVHRGEFRGKPTTAQDALNIYPRKLEVAWNVQFSMAQI